MVVEERGRKLKMARVERGDGGRYRCRAENLAGVAEKEFEVTVLRALWLLLLCNLYDF